MTMEKIDWHGLKISPWDDLIDTRNVINRIEEIESEQFTDEGEEIPEAEWPEDTRTERRVLSELIEGVGEVSARDGVALVRDSHFVDHIKNEYLEIGGEYWEQDPEVRWDKLVPVPRDELYSRPPFKHIDWEAVADEEWSDYSQVEFLGTTYLYIGE